MNLRRSIYILFYMFLVSSLHGLPPVVRNSVTSIVATKKSKLLHQYMQVLQKYGYDTSVLQSHKLVARLDGVTSQKAIKLSFEANKINCRYFESQQQDSRLFYIEHDYDYYQQDDVIYGLRWFTIAKNLFY